MTNETKTLTELARAVEKAQVAYDKAGEAKETAETALNDAREALIAALGGDE